MAEGVDQLRPFPSAASCSTHREALLNPRRSLAPRRYHRVSSTTSIPPASRPPVAHHAHVTILEVYIDDVVVGRPMLGKPATAAMAMDLLPYERSTCFWQRIAYLTRVSTRWSRTSNAGSRSTPTSARPIWPCTPCLPFQGHQHRLAEGTQAGRGHLIDKVLWPPPSSVSTNGRDLHRADRTRRQRRAHDSLLARGPPSYGGTAEEQRNIIARRLRTSVRSRRWF